jgi:hypothetical protein
MEGKVTLHLAEARGGSWGGNREETGRGGGQQEKMEGKTWLQLAAERGESREDRAGRLGRLSAGTTWRERRRFTLLQQEVSPGKIERDQDGEAVSRQNMEGKTALHLAAARGESREDREGTGWGGSQQAEHGGKDSASPCCSKRCVKGR